MEHLTLDDYMAVLRGEMTVEAIEEKARRHLREVCPGCRDGRHHLHGFASSAPVPFSPEDGSEIADDLNGVGLRQLEEERALLRRMREARRRACRAVEALLELPPDQWPRRVGGADGTSAMRSRAFADVLLEEAEERIATSPAVARALASLVRPALDSRPGRIELPWAQELVAEAEAIVAESIAQEKGRQRRT